MKKRVVGLILSFVLSFTLFGCGNNAETKQEESIEIQESGTEVDQEEQKSDMDMGDFVFYGEEGESKYIIRESNFISLDEEIQFTTIRDTDIWNIDGKNVGYIKSGTTISINEHGEDIAFYRIKNPIENTDYEYLFINVDDYISQKPEEEETETTVLSDEYVEEQRMFDEAMELIDDNKTYTIEEIHTLFKDICEKLGTIYDVEVREQFAGTPAKFTLNLNGKELKNIINEKQFLWYILYGPTGANPVDIYFDIDENADTTGDFEATLFIRFHN